MAITYLNASSTDNTNSKQALRADVSVGAPAYSPATTVSGLQGNKNVSQKVLQDGLDYADAQDAFLSNKTQTVHYPSMPSGYNTSGAPDFGDGKFDRALDLSADQEAGSKGEFIYLRPSGTEAGDYDSLTS